MADSSPPNDIRIDGLRLRAPAGPRFAGLARGGAEQLAAEVASNLAALQLDEVSLSELRVRIAEHELGGAPGEAIARAIARQLTRGRR